MLRRVIVLLLISFTTMFPFNGELFFNPVNGTNYHFDFILTTNQYTWGSENGAVQRADFTDINMPNIGGITFDAPDNSSGNYIPWGIFTCSLRVYKNAAHTLYWDKSFTLDLRDANWCLGYSEDERDLYVLIDLTREHLYLSQNTTPAETVDILLDGKNVGIWQYWGRTPSQSIFRVPVVLKNKRENIEESFGYLIANSQNIPSGSAADCFRGGETVFHGTTERTDAGVRSYSFKWSSSNAYAIANQNIYNSAYVFTTEIVKNDKAVNREFRQVYPLTAKNLLPELGTQSYGTVMFKDPTTTNAFEEKAAIGSGFVKNEAFTSLSIDLGEQLAQKYSLQAKQSITYNGKTYNWYQGDFNPTTQTDMLITAATNKNAYYKGSFISNSADALAGNGQRKIATHGNYVHMAYVSMNSVWYKYSTDYGATWTNEKLVYQDQFGMTIKSLSVDGYNNKAAIVFCLTSADMSYNMLAELESGTVISTEELIPYLDGNYDMKPVIALGDYHIILVYKPGASSGLTYRKKYDNASWNGIWTNPAAVPSTNSSSVNPSLGKNYYGGIVHLAYQDGESSTSSIKYQKISIYSGTQVDFSSLTTVSTGTTYIYNRNPSVTDVLYEPCIAWQAMHYWTYMEAAALRYKTGTTWSGLYAYEDKDGYVTSVNVNTIGNTSSFVMAYYEDEGDENTHFVKKENLSAVLEANSTGKYLAVMAGNSYANSKIMSFNESALPYYFNFSNTLNTISKAGESSVSEKILSASNESGVKFYGIGDIEIDGVKIDFPEKQDSINIADKRILSQPFRLSESSAVTYKLTSGKSVSDSATKVSDYERNMKFKLEIIDAATGNTFSNLNEKTFIGFADTSEMGTGYYKIKGLKNEGLAQLKVSVVNPSQDMQYNVINKYSKKSSIQKSFKEEINIESSIPVIYALSQNYPNPFNPSTVISYDIPQASRVTLKVYDILGREVADLVNEFKEAGRYNVKFDASHLSTGIYIYQLRANDYVSVKKMSFVK